MKQISSGRATLNKGLALIILFASIFLGTKYGWVLAVVFFIGCFFISLYLDKK